jgi:hypothetical protein
LIYDGAITTFEFGLKTNGKPHSKQIEGSTNNPKHTCQLATTWFSDNDIIVIHWPAQSPDLNPLNISGSMSSTSFKNMKYHPKEHMNYGRE